MTGQEATHSGEEARVIQEVIEWRAAEPAQPCTCGHNHHGRVEFRGARRTGLAPQWRWCEEPACQCSALRPSPGQTGGAR